MHEQPGDMWHPLYDRVNYPAAGANELIFFSTPVGGSATLIRAGFASTVSKTRRNTNMEQQGVIPTKAFKLHGFSLTFIPLQQAVGAANTANIFDDICRFAYGGLLEFRIVDKPYIFLPLYKIPATGVIRGSVATTATATTIIGGDGTGTGSPRDIYWISVPLVLDPYQNFSARMQFDRTVALTQTFDVQLFLEGLMRRPGQQVPTRKAPPKGSEQRWPPGDVLGPCWGRPGDVAGGDAACSSWDAQGVITPHGYVSGAISAGHRREAFRAFLSPFRTLSGGFSQTLSRTPLIRPPLRRIGQPGGGL